MKKSIIALLALPAIMLASCSSEEPVPDGAADGNVTFAVQLPGGFSRSFADGAKATQLTYAVYESGETTPVISSLDPAAPQASFSGLQAQLTLNLVKGKTYDIVFWADQADAPYTFDPATQSISISYDGVLGNDENRDAFFQTEKGLVVNGAIQKTVTLRRPFAQINFGTNDLDKAAAVGVDVAKTKLTVDNVYSSLNLFSGEASDPQEVAFDYNDLPATEVFPVSGYSYLSMNYLLTGSVPAANVQQADKELINVEFVMQDSNGSEINTLTLSNVPVQRNYRTNIYGALLTSQVDFVIEINPDFETPDHEIEKLLLAAQIGGAVALEADVDMAGVSLVVQQGKQMMLDLNGHNIANATLESWGDLVIRGEGTVSAPQAEAEKINPPAVWARPGSSVTIEGGHFIGSAIDGETNVAKNPACIYAQGSRLMEDGTTLQRNTTVHISGGTFESPENAVVLNEQNNDLSHIVVTGGTFYRQDPKDGDDFKGGNFVAQGYSSIGTEINGVTVYTVAKEQKVNTLEQLKSVFEQGGGAVINDDLAITEELLISKPTTLTVNGNVTSTIARRIQVEADLTVEGSGTFVTGDDNYGVFDVRNGANLTVKNVNFKHTGKTDGSPIGLRDAGTVTLDNVEIDSDFGTVCSWDGSTGKLVANNCTFKSTSNSARNGKNWTYTVLIKSGVEAELNNCTVVGTQGGVSASSGAKITINGGSYSTVLLPDEPKASAFYAVYVAQDAEIVINDGYFRSATRADIYSGDNDISGDPVGNLVVKGGKFCNQGFHQGTNSIVTPAAGYKWQALEGEDPYVWTVVKE